MQAGMAHSTRLVAQLWHSYARHAVHSKAGGCWCATISVSRKPLNYAAKRGMCTQENRSSNPLSSALGISDPPGRTPVSVCVWHSRHAVPPRDASGECAGAGGHCGKPGDSDRLLRQQRDDRHAIRQTPDAGDLRDLVACAGAQER